MPTYEYVCEKCKNHFEVSISFKEVGSIVIFCPYCRTEKVKKVFHMPFVHYNGNGFYKTDKAKK